jgi:MoaA/NifB/PqqE/SkfB family radical SAM enzyme
MKRKKFSLKELIYCALYLWVRQIELFRLAYTRNCLKIYFRGVKNYFVAIFFNKLKAHRLFLCLSHECNADCVHCYEKFLHNKFQHSLTTQEAKDALEQFRRIGGISVFYCSGELLLRDDAFELIRYTRQLGMIATMTTNGILLDESTIDKLKEAGLTGIVVSLDSANAARHDKLRGVEGCFDKAINGLKIAKRKGLYTVIWSYITKSNFNEIDDIARLARRLGVGNFFSRVFVYFPLLSGNLFNRFDQNLTYQEREAFRKKYNSLFGPGKGVLLEFPSEKFPCRGGGKEQICIMPSGDVTFCPPVPYSYGNIRERSLRDCVIDMKADYKRLSDCTHGQCPVNFLKYRNNCRAKFIYD